MSKGYKLEGRVVVVTGAAHGIGKAYVERLAAEGARVAIADLDEDGAQAVAKGIVEGGGEAVAMRTDIADAESARQMAQKTADAFGRIDVLINNASMFSVVPMSRVGFEDISEDEWDRIMKVNVAGPWLCCKAVVPFMRQNNYGKIINISSVTVHRGAPTRIHYVASKAAILGFTRSLASELGDENIMVNCIAPGSTLSEENPTPEVIEMRKARLADRALKRIQAADDLVGAVCFLSSPDSDFMTGQTLVVDGGSFMQ